jgi:hypothetical protein
MTTSTTKVLDERPRARRWVRRYEFAPELVLAVALGWFAVTDPGAAASAFRSGRAVVLMATVAVAWLVLRFAATRYVRHPLATTLLFGVGALAILRVVVLPAYLSHTVVETLSPAWAATPVRAAWFRGIDHSAAGTVRIYRDRHRELIVGLVDFTIQPGPSYDLYLAPGADRRSLERSTALGHLRGNRGTQFYDVPTGVKADHGTWTVLVWCQIFAVPIANATLS